MSKLILIMSTKTTPEKDAKAKAASEKNNFQHPGGEETGTFKHPGKEKTGTFKHPSEQLTEEE